MISAFAPFAYGVGTVTQAVVTNYGETMAVVTFSWTADASAATVPATAMSAEVAGKVFGFYLVQAETDPGTTAPTADYDVTITDPNSLDLMSGSLSNRSATVTEIAFPNLTARPVDSILTFNLSGNAVNSAVGVCKLYFSKLPSANGLTGTPLVLQASVTKAATYSGVPITGLGAFRQMIVTLDITSAERDSANETYDFYITTGDGVSAWDITHFPQIATTGAKRYSSTIVNTILPQEVTTATPGTAANVSGTLKTDTPGSNEGIKTLGAGKVRHGPWGDRISYELVIAGTVVTGIVYSITITPKS